MKIRLQTRQCRQSIMSRTYRCLTMELHLHNSPSPPQRGHTKSLWMISKAKSARLVRCLKNSLMDKNQLLKSLERNKTSIRLSKINVKHMWTTKLRETLYRRLISEIQNRRKVEILTFHQNIDLYKATRSATYYSHRIRTRLTKKVLKNQWLQQYPIAVTRKLLLCLVGKISCWPP